jgi:DNA (cytosine-5)-methyltransferase 1
MTPNLTALDLFAGSGWGVAAHRLGIADHGVEIMDEAVATRTAAGFSTIFRDVWDGLLNKTFLSAAALAVLDAYDVLIASPPCQTFSAAGKGAGRKALDEVLGLVRSRVWADPFLLNRATQGLDPRTALVLVPLAYIRRDRPRYVALEQVPSVLPVWEAYADVMRAMGYSVVTGILNAEQYGVPQTRRRAILIARRDGGVAKLPTPTHSRYYPRDARRLDDGVLKWVSMAEALGWPPADLVGFPRLSDGREEVVVEGTAYRARDLRPASDPAQTVTEKARSWQRFPEWPPGHRINADDVRRLGAEAHERYSDRKGTGAYRATVEEAAALQTYPDSWPAVDEHGNSYRFMTGAGTSSTVNAPRSVWHPAHAVTGQGSADVHNRPSPATSGGGDARPTDARRMTAAEAAALQTYPRPFPFQGSKTSQFLQIGNAVPPLLAEAILSTFLD